MRNEEVKILQSENAALKQQVQLRDIAINILQSEKEAAQSANEVLQSANEALWSANVAKDKIITKLESSLKQALEKIALLKGGKSSRTSSTAPSHDIGRSNKKSLRQKSDRKSGGQIGHTGHTLIKHDTPDVIIDLHADKCTHCGEDLTSVNSETFISRQTVDIPPVTPTYTEHRSHVKTCPHCGKKNQGKFPDNVNAPVQYGSRIQAMIGYLSVFHYIPYKRICSLFKDILGLDISQGTIDNALELLAKNAQSAWNDIKERVQASKVVGADETGCHVNGKKGWFHVWQNLLLTFIVYFDSRGYKVAEKYFKDGFDFAVYVSDCWAAQMKVEAFKHQICLVHLLRELNNFEESLKSEWSRQVKDLFKRAIDLKNIMTEADYANPPPEIAIMETELDKLLAVDTSNFYKKEQNFVKRLIKYRDSIFPFLYQADVPFHNNSSELSIRCVKVKLKVSSQFRNAEGKGAIRYAKLRSVIDTSIKNGQHVYTNLQKLANGELLSLFETEK